MNSSGKETGDDRQTLIDAIDAMPESLPESLNMSASVDLKSAKFVCRCGFANS